MKLLCVCIISAILLFWLSAKLSSQIEQKVNTQVSEVNSASVPQDETQAAKQNFVSEKLPEQPAVEPTLAKNFVALNNWQAYPVITELKQATGIFKQFLIEVQENKQRWAQGKSLLPIVLYQYQIKQQDSLFTISAKTSISVESIATLNRIEHPRGLPRDKSYILLPNNSGIFLPQDQSQDGLEKQPYQSLSPWEQKLRLNRSKILFHRLVVGKRTYFYYPKSQFSQEERHYFLDNVLRSPVQKKLHITSPFGSRRDPISGKSSYHDGLDIRSPYAAPVYSIANGTVLELGESKLYGLFVKIRLDNGKQQVALYGHLTAVLVSKGDRVNAGEAIGNSGKSGRSQGPHLHLSIFQNGKAIDPEPLFKNLY